MPVRNSIGRYITASCGFAPQVVTAAAGIDGAQQNGIIFDRLATVGADVPQSMAVVLSGVATVNTSETLSVACDVQHGAQSNLSDATVLNAGFTATVVKSGNVTASPWQIILVVDLRTCKRYFRCRPTFDLSRAGTDTAAVSVAYILGGGAVTPQA
jgi:hypothetical protein